ncbi:MAG: LuxR C-terminal-related transcriptional regulator [Roseibium sp.]
MLNAKNALNSFRCSQKAVVSDPNSPVSRYSRRRLENVSIANAVTSAFQMPIPIWAYSAIDDRGGNHTLYWQERLATDLEKHSTAQVDSSGSEIDGFLDQIQSINSIAELWSICVGTLEQFGFDYVTYMYLRLDAPHDGPIALTTMPSWWADTYFDSAHICSDPFFRFCGNLKPRRTGADYLDLYPLLSPAERERVELAGEAGCLTGFASPVRLIGNRRCGGWNFGSRLSRKHFEPLYPQVRQQVQLIGFYAHERLEALHLHEIRDSEHASILSPREQECLSYLASGSRTSCIAGLLGISAATVEFHLKNVKRKLGASTREEALAKAITGGAIALPPCAFGTYQNP